MRTSHKGLGALRPGHGQPSREQDRQPQSHSVSLNPTDALIGRRLPLTLQARGQPLSSAAVNLTAAVKSTAQEKQLPWQLQSAVASFSSALTLARHFTS